MLSSQLPFTLGLVALGLPTLCLAAAVPDRPGHGHSPPPRGFPGAPITGPCDIYASGGTPCVAAHSTTRALYGSYSGPLYSVTRSSDGQSISITPIVAGGVADASQQDKFCAGTTCVISMINDQSGNGNDLSQAPSGSAAEGPDGGVDYPAKAADAPVMLNGQKAYGVYIEAGMGYRIDDTKGIAVGNEAEGIYAVVDGTHYNGACCFDYGNAETNNNDNGDAHMETINFSNNAPVNTLSWHGAGSGPWILADLENGLFGGSNIGNNTNDPSIHHRFVHAVVKGKETNEWSIRGGNAQSGSLGTFFDGKRPNGYYPMKKEGAIILGIGGDNSINGVGTFYEGAMTKGYPTDQTGDNVQANIVGAKYAAAT